MESNALDLHDYVAIIKRRKWSIILPALIVFAVSVIVSLVLPPIYKSSSTILIEEQEIPPDFVMTTVTSYVEQRIQTINQRIMSSSRLLEIINRFNLYEKYRDKWTTDEIIEKMREDIVLEPISVETVDRRTGRPTAATIAFTLSYEGKPARTVQKVANVLASLFLEENLQVRERQATETSKFLEDEMTKVKDHLASLEQKIAVFKEKHINQLPELLEVNIQSLQSFERNIERLQEQLRSLKEREGYLQTQLTNVSPELENLKKDRVRLEELKVELVYLESRYSDEYPDVIKTQREIETLEKQLNGSEASTGSDGVLPDNPAYITLASQLASTQSEIESVKRQILDFEKKCAEYRCRIEESPKVDQEYKALMIERNNTQAKYDDLMRKVMEAKVSQGLEKEQKGERFTLIDPARLPEKPYKPNRLAIILIGLVLSMGAGTGFGCLKEYADHSVRNAESLVKATAFPVLGGVPKIITEYEIRRMRTKRYVRMFLILLILAAGLAVFHCFVMDFDIFWSKLMRKIAI